MQIRQTKMTDVIIPTPTHQLRAYDARPSGEGPWPGVVVLHDSLGMSQDLRHQADWLAGAGYLAVAPDLYSWGRTIICVVAFIREIRDMNKMSLQDTTSPRVPSRPLSDLDAAHAWL